MPFTVKDTITIAANSYIYTLNATFVQPTDGQKSDYMALCVSKDGKVSWGLYEGDLRNFGAIPFISNNVTMFAVRGDEFIINAATPIAYKIYVWGPGEITPISHGGSSLTAIPEEEDRWAAVHWAIAAVADERGMPQLASEYRGLYRARVLTRTGALPVTGGP